MQIDIVIVNWNAGQQLTDCVNSINEFGHDLVSEIVIVDNGSVDGSDKAVEGLPKVNLVRAKKNLGFGRACNLGASHAKSQYILFLNPDTTLFETTLPKVLAFMEDPENSQIGICGVQLVDETGHISRSCARFPTVSRFLSTAVGLDRVFKSLGYHMPDWDHSYSKNIDHVIGAFFFMRRSLFLELGGFDTRFFVYLEDLDLSFRAANAGWRSFYLANVQAFHYGGGTSDQVKAHRLFYSLRSRIQYAFKHFSTFGAVMVLFATVFVEPVSRLVLAIARRSFSSVKELWIAYSWLLKWLVVQLFGVVFKGPKN